MNLILNYSTKYEEVTRGDGHVDLQEDGKDIMDRSCEQRCCL